MKSIIKNIMEDRQGKLPLWFKDREYSHYESDNTGYYGTEDYEAILSGERQAVYPILRVLCLFKPGFEEIEEKEIDFKVSTMPGKFDVYYVIVQIEGNGLYFTLSGKLAGVWKGTQYVCVRFYVLENHQRTLSDSWGFPSIVEVLSREELAKKANSIIGAYGIPPVKF